MTLCVEIFAKWLSGSKQMSGARAIGVLKRDCPTKTKKGADMPRAELTDAMSSSARRNVAVHTMLHPAVYAAVVGCVIWMLLAAWYWFGNGSDVTLALAAVTGFSMAFVGIPIVIWRASSPAKRSRAAPLSEWMQGEFEGGSGQLHAWEAAIMVLLLPVASAVGLTAISIVAHLAASGTL
jgi:hypothetical protein